MFHLPSILNSWVRVPKLEMGTQREGTSEAPGWLGLAGEVVCAFLLPLLFPKCSEDLNR